MKKVVVLLTFILGGLFFAPAPAHAAGPNLIANPSMETAETANKPQNWARDKWGTNTSTMTYLNTGHTGTHSVKTQTTNYTDGDAKWFFTPVAVAANTKYTFSDYYQSNKPTEIVVRYTDTSGAFAYEWLGTAAKSSTTWTQANFTFTTPANVKKVTVYHLVSSVGWLTIDDASLAQTETTPPPDPIENLVANPSLETGISGNPDKWQKGTWGTNASSFTYQNTGHTGSHSAKVEVSNFTDGDAKWFFDPVNIAPGTNYSFSDYYKSNTPTEVIVRFTHADGSFSYQVLGTTPASATWKQASYAFTTPATATHATVFHIVSSVGWLDIDDVTLAKDETGPIPNPSLEAASTNTPNQPSQWTGSGWGSNSRSFEYMNEGRTGTKSAKVTVSNYTDGDAKWVYDPQPLTPGKTYSFGAWYKTNALPQVVAQFESNSGATTYLTLPAPLPGANSATAWQQYKDSFTVPMDTKNVTVFMMLANNGWLQTDDYTIGDYTPTGFNRALLSLTFDDGEEDNVTTALPVMNANNIKSTQCFATEHVEGNAENIAAVQAFRDAGHEICSHTVTHPFLTQVNATQLNTELTNSKSLLQTVTGMPIKNFASPYGDYNPTVLNAIKPLYRSHRTVDTGYNSKDNFDAYRVRVQNMLSTTTLAELQGWVDHAKATNTWLVLVYHRIAPSDAGPYDTPQANFTPQIQAIVNSGITVKTYDAALDELTPQL
jgi:peptidoglycan/xylan/chitin deacetylase (PgdA/CDA1 family)